eukprot:GEMP01011842.1.p1 GENE.GEMP01011842.1~~GEMP01011842.1.p1  ORF type:complete len:771 (-),score=298.89 GEMP01011842.1:665-2977(-)
MTGKMDKPAIIWESGWDVTTLSGSEHAGYCDGRHAQFSHPESVTVDKRGDVYVADFKNNRLRKITVPDGTAYTVAGTGDYGSKDGAARDAQFKYPLCMTTTQGGEIVLAESNRIRAYAPKENMVRTIASGTDAGVTYPSGVAMSADNYVLVSNTNNHRIIKVNASGNHGVETVAGLGYAGFADGEWRKARFHKPWGIAVSIEGDIYVADSKNHRIRKIDGRTRNVSTVAGTGKQGWRDGEADEGRFNRPRGVAIAMDGCVYIADSGNHCIRKLDLVDRRLVTIAGDGAEGGVNGEGYKAQFRWPRGLAFGPDGVLYLADRGNHCVRAISKQAESALAAVEEELEQVVEQRDNIRKEIEHDASSAVAAEDSLIETRNAIRLAREQLEEAQRKLREKRLILHNFVAQRKAEVRLVKKELHALKETKGQKAHALASAQAELDKARAALDQVSTMGGKCTKELTSVDEQLKRAGWGDALEGDKNATCDLDAQEQGAAGNGGAGNGEGRDECKDETVKEESTMNTEMDVDGGGGLVEVVDESAGRKRHRSEDQGSREEGSAKRHQNTRSEDGGEHIDDSYPRENVQVEVQEDAAQEECMEKQTDVQVDMAEKDDVPSLSDVDECMEEQAQVQVDMAAKNDVPLLKEADECMEEKTQVLVDMTEKENVALPKNVEECLEKQAKVQVDVTKKDNAALPKDVEECLEKQAEGQGNLVEKETLPVRKDVESTEDHVVKQQIPRVEKNSADVLIDDESVERQIELAEKENMKLLKDLDIN